MITVVGLGPGSLDRVSPAAISMLLDPVRTIVVRTAHHPAAAELADRREVIFCDDLYEQSGAFDDVYQAIADRVIGTEGPVVYAVPGSPLVGEFAVSLIREQAGEVEVIPGESFVDAVLAEVRYDPLDRGLQILNGHELPDPLILDKPTIIAHLDRPEILADAIDAVGRVTLEGSQVTLISGIGAGDAKTVTATPAGIDTSLAGFRTSLFVDAEPGGLIGAIQVMRRLRAECPWDMEQTHRSLVKNLIEEAYELIEAIGDLPEAGEDWVAYSRVEDELGDVLLQVLFHESIARERGAFDIDGVAGVLTEKLMRRHPHVFGDVEVADAGEVKENWDRIKDQERGAVGDSLMEGVPVSMPALSRAAKLQNRAAKAGFDWDDSTQVLAKLGEEAAEVAQAIAGYGDVEAETGDLLFTVVNLARHLGVDPELALRGAVGRFETRFRQMEAAGPLDGLGIAELDARWEEAKKREDA
jgi:tetrapyrrole methylase family protein/MazG family protein